jgi:hypothetical protein
VSFCGLLTDKRGEAGYGFICDVKNLKSIFAIKYNKIRLLDKEHPPAPNRVAMRRVAEKRHANIICGNGKLTYCDG